MAKSKLQKKEVKFQGSKLILYSLDGITWSTNKDELEIILQRLEAQRAGLNEKLGKNEEVVKEEEDDTVKGKEPVKTKSKKAKVKVKPKSKLKRAA